MSLVGGSTTPKHPTPITISPPRCPRLTIHCIRMITSVTHTNYIYIVITHFKYRPTIINYVYYLIDCAKLTKGDLRDLLNCHSKCPMALKSKLIGCHA